MKKIIGSGSGGKGGGGTARAAQEESDSLQSISYAQVLDLVSEGEIEGLVNGMKSVYLDDTPLMDDFGNYNFSGVTVDYRLGTQFQDPISGFPSSVNEISVGAEVKSSTPVVRTISNDLITATYVRVGIPQLTYQDPSNGDLKGSQVQFVIETNSNGGGWVQRANDLIIGKCTSKYVKSYRIDLPANGPHQIRVRKITQDSTQVILVNKIYWESYSEIIDAKLSFPNSALMALRVDATNFKSIPTRSYDLRLLKIKVPTNYDPILKSYSGIWDGTFKIAWTDNPAWVLYDLLTARYGVQLDTSMIDKFSLYKIGKYCDELVDNGFGSKEARFSINCYLQTRTDAYTLLKDITNVFRGLSLWQGGTLVTTQDSPQDPAWLFTPSNVINGEFSYQGTSKKNRYSVALVTWNDPDDMFRQKVEYVEDPEAISKYGVVQIEINSFGCASQGQAHRVGKWAIYSSQYETETVTFQTGIEAASVRLGQIIKVQDPMRAGSRLSGRVSSATTSTVTLDQEYSFDFVGNSYIISCITSDGSVVDKPILSAAGKTITINGSFSSIPFSQSVYIIQNQNVEAQLFRVVSVGEQDGKYTITGMAHDPKKYDYIEKNIKISKRNISTLSVTPEKPTGLKITETLYISNGEVKPKVTFSWNATLNAAYYYCSYRKTNGNLVDLGTVVSNEVEIINIDQGVYDFFVSASSSFDLKSEQSTFNYEVLGKAYPPGNVQNFSLVPLNGFASLKWDKTIDLDVQIGGKVRIRYSPILTSTWKDSIDVAELSGSSTTAQVPMLNGLYLAKFVDSSGISSNLPATIQASNVEQTQKNLIATLTESPSFLGTKSDMFVSSFYGGLLISADLLIDELSGNVDDVLAWDFLGGTATSGEYYFSNYVDLTDVYVSNVTVAIDAGAVDVADTIDMRSDKVDLWQDLDGVFIDDVNAEIYFSTTNDDPASGSAVWSVWKRFFQASYTARAYKFKLVATSQSNTHNIVIRNLAVSIDMPDRQINISQITSSTSGSAVVYEKPFAVMPSVGITAYNMNTGDYYRITSASQSGFTITFYNSSSVAIVRTFDVIAKGYGRKIS